MSAGNMTATAVAQVQHGSTRCGCPTCSASKAMRDLDAAHNAWLEQSSDAEMRLAFLLDEVIDVLPSLSPEQFFRLQAALRVAGVS